MSPPGNWDFGSAIGEYEDPQLASASVILSAPGLTWEQLITGQAQEGKTEEQGFLHRIR